jgi:hypothetical protein
MTPAEYHALPQPEQRKAALALGSARLGLAVALAAHAGATDLHLFAGCNRLTQ